MNQTDQLGGNITLLYSADDPPRGSLIVMPNGDREGQVLTRIMELFCCSPLNTIFFIFEKHEKGFQKFLNTYICHDDVILTYNDSRSGCVTSLLVNKNCVHSCHKAVHQFMLIHYCVDKIT